MLATVKQYISELSDLEFVEFYQQYICKVQDANIQIEVSKIKSDEILSLTSLLSALNRELR